jgi:hypothetical protein
MLRTLGISSLQIQAKAKPFLSMPVQCRHFLQGRRMQDLSTGSSR